MIAEDIHGRVLPYFILTMYWYLDRKCSITTGECWQFVHIAPRS
uniref:Uncharacterized protein n=1 Tax=Anguilla anguilla TaxID=7936 RepID=A0A0E9XKA9_ANGAN